VVVLVTVRETWGGFVSDEACASDAVVDSFSGTLSVWETGIRGGRVAQPCMRKKPLTAIP
jgi:hypothetical protein